MKHNRNYYFGKELDVVPEINLNLYRMSGGRERAEIIEARKREISQATPSIHHKQEQQQ